MTRSDKIFDELRRAVSKPDKQEVRHNSWILEETWILMHKRVFVRREPGRGQKRVKRLGQAIWAALKEGKRQRVETAGKDVEWILTGEPPLP